MKKRTAVALLLTLALLTTLLPAALAADWPDQLVDAGPWVNADESRTDELVYAMETGYGYEDFIIVYYNTQCGNSSLYVPQFYQLLQQAGSTLDVTVYGVNYEFAGIPFSLFEDYSVSFPTVVVFDADRGTYDAYKRVTSLSRFAEIIGVDMPDLELNQLLTDIPINPDLASMTSSPGLIARYTSGDVLPQEWEVLKLVNQERMAEGLQPLTTGYTLQQAAHARIEDLQLEYRPDHSRPNGAPCTEVAEALPHGGGVRHGDRPELFHGMGAVLHLPPLYLQWPYRHPLHHSGGAGPDPGRSGREGGGHLYGPRHLPDAPH